jgi:hypothetical protein
MIEEAWIIRTDQKGLHKVHQKCSPVLRPGPVDVCEKWKPSRLPELRAETMPDETRKLVQAYHEAKLSSLLIFCDTGE